MLAALGNINLILQRRSTGSLTSAQFNLQCYCFAGSTCRASRRRCSEGASSHLALRVCKLISQTLETRIRVFASTNLLQLRSVRLQKPPIRQTVDSFWLNIVLARLSRTVRFGGASLGRAELDLAHKPTTEAFGQMVRVCLTDVTAKRSPRQTWRREEPRFYQGGGAEPS